MKIKSLQDYSTEKAPDEWEEIPEIAEDKPKDTVYFKHYLRRLSGLNICLWMSKREDPLEETVYKQASSYYVVEGWSEISQKKLSLSLLKGVLDLTDQEFTQFEQERFRGFFEQLLKEPLSVIPKQVEDSSEAVYIIRAVKEYFDSTGWPNNNFQRKVGGYLSQYARKS